MKWKHHKGGLVLGMIAAVYILFLGFFTEYQQCKNNWESMCGTGIMFASLYYGLGIPFITTALFGYLGRVSFGFSGNFLYLFTLVWSALGFFISYFLVGSFFEFIYHKLSKRAKKVFWGIIIAVITWVVLFFILGIVEQSVNKQEIANRIPQSEYQSNIFLEKIKNVLGLETDKRAFISESGREDVVIPDKYVIIDNIIYRLTSFVALIIFAIIGAICGFIKSCCVVKNTTPKS